MWALYKIHFRISTAEKHYELLELGFPIGIPLRGIVRSCAELCGTARNCAELQDFPDYKLNPLAFENRQHLPHSWSDTVVNRTLPYLQWIWGLLEISLTVPLNTSSRSISLSLFSWFSLEDKSKIVCWHWILNKAS